MTKRKNKPSSHEESSRYLNEDVELLEDINGRYKQELIWKAIPKVPGEFQAQSKSFLDILDMFIYTYFQSKEQEIKRQFIISFGPIIGEGPYGLFGEGVTHPHEMIHKMKKKEIVSFNPYLKLEYTDFVNESLLIIVDLIDNIPLKDIEIAKDMYYGMNLEDLKNKYNYKNKQGLDKKRRTLMIESLIRLRNLISLNIRE